MSSIEDYLPRLRDTPGCSHVTGLPRGWSLVPTEGARGDHYAMRSGKGRMQVTVIFCRGKPSFIVYDRAGVAPVRIGNYESIERAVERVRRRLLAIKRLGKINAKKPALAKNKRKKA